MDISDTLAPDSQQLDAVDLLSGPRTFTIDKVTKGNDEQPVQIHLVEFDRPWRPGKSMRRVLVACWGADTTVYVGRRVELFCDPDVRFGGQAVGGTRISRLSHLDKPKSVPLLVSRGKSAVYIVKPLGDDAPAPAPAPPPDPRADLWAALRKAGVPNADAKEFVEGAVGRTLASGDDLEASEAADILDNFDALLAAFMADGSAS